MKLRPRRRRRWQPLQPHIVTHLTRHYGLSDADLRDCRPARRSDHLIVRLWNHRRIRVSGVEQITWKQTFPPINISGLPSSIVSRRSDTSWRELYMQPEYTGHQYAGACPCPKCAGRP